MKRYLTLIFFLINSVTIAQSVKYPLESSTVQSILPPEIPWSGKSETLIAKANDPWITPTEKSGFVTTPTYDETMSWLKKLADASPLITMISIGKSAEGRDINMIIASTEDNITSSALKNSGKPLLLVQSGIHSGEIDGKDAGMMLLRDIAFGKKKSLLEKVNFLFIPILNVDGHERSSPFNRPNQRGPLNMGWRTNAQNLNLNRDFAKLDTREVRAVIQVMNDYDPLLYMDIHVTDGADYQCDITYGGTDGQSYSIAISNWIEKKFKPYADGELKTNGHIPGQLLNAFNGNDFSQGNIAVRGEPRFSDAYGDLRHMASILVENHSLKPFRQRVLGTYILLESALKYLASDGKSLKESTETDKAKRDAKVSMLWKVPQLKRDITYDAHETLDSLQDHSAKQPDSLDIPAISSTIVKSPITNSDYAEWTGKPINLRVANYKGTQRTEWITRPKAYWVPASRYDIIERLKMHGIKMEIISESREVSVEMYRIQDVKYENEPFEGHIQLSGTPKPEIRKQLFSAGSAIISTDQPLGDLAMALLEPSAPDSYFRWGFFMPIFQRTEYIEAYVMEPTMKQMLDESPQLRKEFEQKKASEPLFAKSPEAIYEWFYSKTKYYDDRYLLYPIGREL